MTHRSWRWVLLGIPVLAACAQVIGADFDGLLPDNSSGGSAGTTQAGGASGNAGASAPAGGAAGQSAGGGGSAGAAGNVIGDASADKMGPGGATASPDAMADRSATDGASSEDGEAKDGPLTPGSVVINEIKGQGGGPDWVELFNPGELAMVLDGYAITQAMGTTGPPDPAGMLTFPQGTSLAGGAFLMVVAQQPSIGGPTMACQSIATDCFTVTWGISMSGERVYLLNPEPDGGTAIQQQVDYLASVMNGQTYARASNGTFQAAAPTPGQPNGI